MKENKVLHQIANLSLRERVLDILRDAILAGEFQPGQSLVEADLATQLGVSRAPVREALQTLNTEGLIDTVPYHGTKVRRLTRIDIEEIYSLRGVLESFAIQRIIERNDEADINKLRSILDEMYLAARQGDLKSLSGQDQNFHTTLIRLSHHSLLISIWNMVAMRVRQVMALRNQTNQDITQIARNHLPIIESIVAGDTRRAQTLISQHAASAADLILEDWAYDEIEEEETA